MTKESQTTVSPPPVELQEGTAENCTTTIYSNGTSAKVSVELTGAGVTDVEDYVDNNSWDEDGVEKGTHGNFSAQQYGPDLINDTLTETSPDNEWLDCNAYDSTYTDWTSNGTSPYLDAQDQPTNYVYEADTAGNMIGWFDFPNTTLTGTLQVNISIYCNNDDGSGEDYAYVFVDYTGSGAGTNVGNVAQHTNWDYDTIDLGSHTVSEVNNLRVYFGYAKIGGADDVRIDHARIGVSIVCELDLEVQWTNVDYDEPYELLCIYGGTMGDEDITVDVWNGTGWQNVFLDLSSGWNNVSVGSYLDSSNFTIRFKGGTESGDTTQHSWEIDATLLHVWTAPEVLGSATTVSTSATSRAVSYGKDRAVLRTTDANSTLYVFQIDSNDDLQWWKSTDNGTTWSKQISTGIGSVDSFSVKKDSSNYIHIAYATSVGSVFYRKQLYNATSWGGSEPLAYYDDSPAYHPDVAIAPYNNDWVYVVYDDYASSPEHNEVWVRASTNGGTSFGSAVELTYNEASYTGTFPSIVIDNTLGTYGHVYVTWYRGSTYLYLRRGNITSTGAINWDGDSNVQTISSGMSTSVTENTNMMHSAMYANGKYRVVYCESGTAKYRDWDEISWSSPLSLATVSHYPSITYDWNNYIYVFYHTNDTNPNYDIRYQRSTDNTPTGFGPAQNVTDDNNGNRYVNAKLGGDNERVEFAWTNGTSSYSVEYNSIAEDEGGGQGDFNYVLKFVEKDNSNWTIRLTAYDNSSMGRLDNCSIYIYNGSNSTQIVILNGDYENQTGPWIALNASDTEYIWMHIETSSAGTSYVYVHLEIRIPDTTTYLQYKITFEIT